MINSTLCYLERGDAYLMLHRVKKKGDLNHDKWIGVGGKFEDGESPEDCILRETWEETGLTLTDYRYRGLVTFVSDEAPTEYMHLFTATGWTVYEDEEVDIYIGAHADDAAGNAYADCSEPFLKAMEDAISIGTYGKVHLVFPFADKNKAGVVKTGLALGTPYELTWSCYEGGEKPCGTCGTCRDRAAAFEANGVKDPALD